MRFAIALLLGLFGGACLAPVPNLVPTPRLEWDWKELEEPLEAIPVAVTFSADGEFLAAGAKDRIGVWSLDTKKQMFRVQLPTPQTAVNLAFTKDGKELVSDGREDPVIRFWDLKTGKQSRELVRKVPPADGMNKYVSPFRGFNPHGEFLIDYMPRRATALQILDFSNGDIRPAVLVPQTGFDYRAEVAFSPDGKTFAVNGPRSQLRVFDIASGKLVREMRAADRGGTTYNYSSTIRYSPDGRYLVAGGQSGALDSPEKPQLAIWGVEDGVRYSPLSDPRARIGLGNRYLLSDAKSVYDLFTDERVPIGNGAAEDVAPKGLGGERVLLGTSPNGSILVFHGPPSAEPGNVRLGKRSLYLTPAPVLHPLPRPKSELSEAAAAAVWKGIGSDNLFRRNYCAEVLTAQPALALELARAKLKPVPAAEGERVGKWIKDLDDDNANVRDAAQVELQKVGWQFETAIKEARKAAQPGETRNRLTAVLRVVSESEYPADLIADLRAVAFLAGLKSTEANKHLKTIASGAAGAKLTSEASAVLAGGESVPGKQ
jgi:hypothetical protein